MRLTAAFGAASASSVGRMGASSKRTVRAGGVAGAADSTVATPG
jgi:hypothetical protein